MGSDPQISSFGQYLRALRGDRMLREIATRGSMGTGSLSHFEGDKYSDPRLSSFRKLAQCYRVPVEDLVLAALRLGEGADQDAGLIRDAAQAAERHRVLREVVETMRSQRFHEPTSQSQFVTFDAAADFIEREFGSEAQR